MPPFYIGSTSVSKIQKGYKGSAMSKEYKDIWNLELRNNPHLFHTEVVSLHKTRKGAFDAEAAYQREEDVVRSELYINAAIANRRFNMFGKKDSKETKLKKSKAQKGRISAMKGKKHSEETKAKISAWNIGKTVVISEEHKKKISKTLTGRTRSEETKKKIAAASKGRKHTEESKKKMSLLSKGKPKSKEHCLKLSIARQKYCEERRLAKNEN